MIPQRIPAGETYGSSLKERVTACRKRLRVNRAAQKSTGWERRPGRLRAAPAADDGRRQRHAEYDLAPAILALEREQLQLVEQEVGIT
jgi:hypothetical protein